MLAGLTLHSQLALAPGLLNGHSGCVRVPGYGKQADRQAAKQTTSQAQPARLAAGFKSEKFFMGLAANERCVHNCIDS